MSHRGHSAADWCGIVAFAAAAARIAVRLPFMELLELSFGTWRPPLDGGRHASSVRAREKHQTAHVPGASVAGAVSDRAGHCRHRRELNPCRCGELQGKRRTEVPRQERKPIGVAVPARRRGHLSSTRRRAARPSTNGPRNARAFTCSVSPVVSAGNGGTHKLYELGDGKPCLIDTQNQKGGFNFPPDIGFPPTGDLAANRRSVPRLRSELPRRGAAAAAAARPHARPAGPAAHGNHTGPPCRGHAADCDPAAYGADAGRPSSTAVGAHARPAGPPPHGTDARPPGRCAASDRHPAADRADARSPGSAAHRSDARPSRRRYPALRYPAAHGCHPGSAGRRAANRT